MNAQQPAGETEFLIFDASDEGHRRNYVRLLAGLTGGTALIAPLGRAGPRLLKAKGLVLTTFETAPLRFSTIILARALLGRRSAALFLRAHLYRRGGLGKRLVYGSILRLLNALPSVLLLTVVPVPLGSQVNRFVTVADPETWDSAAAVANPPETALGALVRDQAGSRPILLFTGVVEATRGVGFLAQICAASPELARQMLVVVAGSVAADAQVAVQSLASSGAFIESRFLDDEEMMSLFASATAVWCCFPPERDMTSGVFGRAVQFGAAPIVRRGSILEQLSDKLPNRVVLTYGDVEAAVTCMKSGFRRILPIAPEARQQERQHLSLQLRRHFDGTDRD